MASQLAERAPGAGLYARLAGLRFWLLLTRRLNSSRVSAWLFWKNLARAFRAAPASISGCELNRPNAKLIHRMSGKRRWAYERSARSVFEQSSQSGSVVFRFHFYVFPEFLSSSSRPGRVGDNMRSRMFLRHGAHRIA